ncbi:protein PRY2-like isoform X1 [Orbicella faveolata]|uniref:protein PRY2-like isoform X1 n=1 Tax=Orbicella faveolata TaxID=48498 RepID=UPI0009E36248|nr:protein PRY2-like isoform X1 [Orbicella faveolata]XP_020627504.1 protein PRY2-like isoform X1 [Orbicella faveolata]
MELNRLNLKRVSLLLLIPVLLQAKELGPHNTRTNHVLIANATKKSSDVLINTGVVLTKKPKSLSPLIGRGNRRIEVQRPLPEDGTDETREYEEELNDTSAPATDILSEVTGRERNKEEILDAVRPYKSQDDDKFIIQDGRRPGHFLGKELNKLKNKGLLVGAEDDKQSAYGPEESIAEAASRKTLEIYIAEEKADQQKRHDENRNIQSPQNDSIAVVKQEDKPKNTSGTGTLPNTTTLANPTMATNIITSVTPSNRSSTGSNAVFQEALVAHNKLRAMHHVFPLQWNATLAEQAQRTAESVASDPSTFQGEPVGENIAQIWHDLPRAPLKATTIWYSEKKAFSFSYPELNDKVKHFTQMVWKDTTQLGMGAAPSPSGKYVIVVALYRPLGNDIHRIRDNVQRAGPVQDVYATIKEKISKPNAKRHTITTGNEGI